MSFTDALDSDGKYISRQIGQSSGSNLYNHVKGCDLKQLRDQGQPKIDAKIPQHFRKGIFRYKLLNWVTRRHRPDAIVEDPELIDIFTYLNPAAQPPSRQSLRRDIDVAFKMTCDELKKWLHEYQGCFNLILDCWTAGNGHEFLGVLISFIHNGQLIVVALDMIE